MKRIAPKLAWSSVEILFWIYLVTVIGPLKTAFVAVWTSVLLGIIWAFLRPEVKDNLSEHLALRAVDSYGLTLTRHDSYDDDDDEDDDEEEEVKE